MTIRASLTALSWRIPIVATSARACAEARSSLGISPGVTRNKFIAPNDSVRSRMGSAVTAQARRGR